MTEGPAEGRASKRWAARRKETAKSARRETGTRRYVRIVPAMVGSFAGAAILILTASLPPSPAAAAQEASAPVQEPQAAQPSQAPSALLQATLIELRSTIAELHIAKWKAPGPVRDEAQGNAASIERDLQNTLPSLLSQADAAPQSVASTFAVYRNLDALYEVLLRVSGTAELAAPDGEAGNLAHSLMTLDAARRALAESILAGSRAQEAALLLARQAPPPASAPPAPTTTVVSDGPAAAAPAHRKAKPRPKPAQQTSPPS